MAYEILSQSMTDKPNVLIRRLDFLHFQYRNRRLSYSRPIARAVPFICRLNRRLKHIRREVMDWHATHVVNDFEPLLARVARNIKLPLISLDHQHSLGN